MSSGPSFGPPLRPTFSSRFGFSLPRDRADLGAPLFHDPNEAGTKGPREGAFVRPCLCPRSVGRTAGKVQGIVRPPSPGRGSPVAPAIRFSRNLEPQERIREGMSGRSGGSRAQGAAQRVAPLPVRTVPVPAGIHHEVLPARGGGDFFSVGNVLRAGQEIGNVQRETVRGAHARIPQAPAHLRGLDPTRVSGVQIYLRALGLQNIHRVL